MFYSHPVHTLFCTLLEICDLYVAQFMFEAPRGVLGGRIFTSVWKSHISSGTLYFFIYFVFNRKNGNVDFNNNAGIEAANNMVPVDIRLQSRLISGLASGSNCPPSSRMSRAAVRSNVYPKLLHMAMKKNEESSRNRYGVKFANGV